MQIINNTNTRVRSEKYRKGEEGGLIWMDDRLIGCMNWYEAYWYEVIDVPNYVVVLSSMRRLLFPMYAG